MKGFQMNIIKHIIGIDVSKDSLSVAYGSLDSSQSVRTTSAQVFTNTTVGFKKLLVWANGQKQDKTLAMSFLMEATGVYYENLAYYLTDHGCSVIVVLPNKAKFFARSLEIKSKTDSLDAIMLAKLGLSRQLSPWKPPTEALRQLKALCREYQAIVESAAQLKNRLHAKKQAYDTSKSILKHLQSQIRFTKSIAKQIRTDIEVLVKKDSVLKEKVDNITTIKGVGLMTAISIIAETNGFSQIRNCKQLASYAGLDVVRNESGSLQHKTRISRKGNEHIRRAVYMSALSACRYNQRLKNLYDRLCTKNKPKMVGLIAVARKLLLLIYTLYKNNVPYDPDFAMNTTN
jgi:transposase